jgi:putative acetyltransferase
MIRPAAPDDAARNLQIWRDAVRATHDFLTPQDLAAIDVQVAEHLPDMVSWVRVDADDRPTGFMAMTGAHIDALFVDPGRHGQGIGRALVNHARTLHPDLTVDVNEQNPLATGFYERLGFRRTGRSETDDQGRPYPLLHLELRG